MKTMAQRILALTFLLVSAIPADAFAQTSGTVTGVVTKRGPSAHWRARRFTSKATASAPLPIMRAATYSPMYRPGR